MRTLFQRNKLWSAQVQAYLTEIFNECNNFLASSTTQPNRTFSITTLDRDFNNFVCVDHFFLDEIILFHVMDTVSRYSAASVVQFTGLSEAMCAFKPIWTA